MILGFRLGFRASYEIRNQREEPTDNEKGIFKSTTEAAEFDLLDEEKDEV